MAHFKGRFKLIKGTKITTQKLSDATAVIQSCVSYLDTKIELCFSSEGGFDSVCVCKYVLCVSTQRYSHIKWSCNLFRWLEARHDLCLIRFCARDCLLQNAECLHGSHATVLVCLCWNAWCSSRLGEVSIELEGRCWYNGLALSTATQH